MLAPSTRIGPYEIVGHIGSGGMGDVYRARDTKLGRDVAIKILPASVSADPERLARFEREARLLASVNHPNIAQIYGLDSQERREGERAFVGSFIVMELVEGKTLADRIAQASRSPLPLAEALDIARQLADALDAAHERGIVHRDLKPANIALAPDGTVKVLDFGLAKAWEPGGSSDASRPGREDLTHSPTMLAPTMDGVLLGTAPYMSPEQARGKAVDKRTDIWAFGCVLYEMLTGRRAFGGETTADTMAAILEREPDWSALPPTPPHVVHLLRRTLDKDARRRLRDIGDAKIDLDPSTRADAITAERVVTPRAATRLPWAIAALALLAAVAALARPMWSVESGAPHISRIARLTSGPAREYGPAISPDGKWVAYAAVGPGADDRSDVWVKFVAGGEPVNLTANAGLDVTLTTGVGGLDISPDGTRVAVAAKPRGSSGAFSTWELPAPLPGVPRRLLDAGLMGARWSPDGRRIAYIRTGSSAGDALWVADADGANAREIVKAAGGIHIHWPAWSADGHLYFIRTRSTIANLDQADTYRIDPRGGTIEPVVTSARRAAFAVPLLNGSGLVYASDQQSAELSLWWRPFRGSSAALLTSGLGDYSEPRATPDGSVIVATYSELRQSLERIAIDAAPAPGSTTLTSGYTGDFDPAIAPRGDRIVFSSSRAGARTIWTSRLDGTAARPLTAGNALDQWPSLSPDGRNVAFVSDRGGKRGIWIVAADGGTPRKLVEANSLGGLTWSHDASRIAYAADAGDWPGLWTVRVADSRVERLPTPNIATDPSWSPVGDVIAYLSPNAPGTTGSLVRLAFVDGSGRPLFAGLPGNPDIPGGLGNGLIAWSPDGRRVAVANQNTNTAVSIWLIEPEIPNAAFRKVAQLAPGPRIRGMAWIPDGSALIIGKHDWTSDIVLMDLAR